jgi:acetyl-CoA carboxylase biotin carboxyl carrier protein
MSGKKIVLQWGIKEICDISMKLTADLLEQFAKVLEKYDLAEMRYEEEECELHIVRKIESSVSFQAPIAQAPMAMPQVVSSPASVTPQVTDASGAQVVDASLEQVKAPIVGTAYLSPEPGAPAFIKVGDRVKKDQPIMIIEAMKVMNQLKSPLSGTIKNILVTNAKPVEFGDVLIIIQKD